MFCWPFLSAGSGEKEGTGDALGSGNAWPRLPGTFSRKAPGNHRAAALKLVCGDKRGLISVRGTLETAGAPAPATGSLEAAFQKLFCWNSSTYSSRASYSQGTVKTQKDLEAHFNFTPPQRTCTQTKKANLTSGQNTQNLHRKAGRPPGDIRPVGWGIREYVRKETALDQSERKRDEKDGGRRNHAVGQDFIAGAESIPASSNRKRQLSPPCVKRVA